MFWLEAVGEDEKRERSELRNDGKNNEPDARVVVEQAGENAAEEPAAAIAQIEQAEGEVPFAFRKDTGDQDLEEGVLRCVANAPKQQSAKR